MKAVTRTRSPRGEGDRLRTELLEATVDVIAETGSIDNVSLRAAAKRAGVSPTAVYQHFEDRDALVEAAVIHCWEAFQTTFAQALDEPDPFRRLRAGGELYVQFALEHPRQYAVMIGETDRLPGVVPIGLETFNGLVGMIKDILDANGDDRDPTFVAVQVHTWTHGMVTLAACAPEIPWPGMDELLDDLMARLGLTPAST